MQQAGHFSIVTVFKLFNLKKGHLFLGEAVKEQLLGSGIVE